MTNRSGSKRPLITPPPRSSPGSQGDDPVERRTEVGQQGRPVRHGRDLEGAAITLDEFGRHRSRLGMAGAVPALGAIQIVSRFTNPSLAAMGEPRDRRPGAGSES